MLRSHPSSVFGLKYYVPLLLFGFTFIFWNSHFRFGALVILIPLLIGLLFHASLAILQVPDGNILYRRLFKWKTLRFDEITGCGEFGVWGIGYIRLSQFVLPWGRLYFVLDTNGKLFGRGDYPLLRFIQEHMESESNRGTKSDTQGSIDSETGQGPSQVGVVIATKKNWFRWLFSLVFLLAGGSYILFLFQVQKAIRSGESPASAFEAAQQKFWHILLNPWVFASCLLVLVVILWNTVRAIARKERHANDLWVTAALLVAIVVLVFRFFQSH
jgi:hypothetical protein